jgi:hypothetical protein
VVNLVGLKDPGGIGQELVTPLVIHRLSDLVFAAQLADRPAAQPFNHHLRLELVIPLATLHRGHPPDWIGPNLLS